MSELFPLPLGPQNATVSPAAIDRLRPFTAGVALPGSGDIQDDRTQTNSVSRQRYYDRKGFAVSRTDELDVFEHDRSSSLR